MSKPGFTRAEPDARRLSLIEATARVLARDGASGASVRAIAIAAGVSPGLVAHHFGGVDALIAATYAHVGEQVAAALDAAVAAAGDDPQARLIAYVTASFAPSIADRDLLATWTAFWGLVIARGEIAALHDAQYARYREELEALLAACGLQSTARRRAARAIAALVDGLWLELCLSPTVLEADEARAIAQAHIAALLEG
jgi:TetR/AcrR family transcriptional repressor of bet genes